jgi:acetyl-CoA synthetase
MLKSFGVGKGDVVCIYLPMIPEAVFAMLACARIGAAHTVVFAGFSMDSLRDRIQDGNAKVVLTADEGIRAKKSIRLKDIVDAAVSECPSVTVKNLDYFSRKLTYFCCFSMLLFSSILAEISLGILIEIYGLMIFWYVFSCRE